MPCFLPLMAVNFRLAKVERVGIKPHTADTVFPRLVKGR